MRNATALHYIIGVAKEIRILMVIDSARCLSADRADGGVGLSSETDGSGGAAPTSGRGGGANDGAGLGTQGLGQTADSLSPHSAAASCGSASE